MMRPATCSWPAMRFGCSASTRSPSSSAGRRIVTAMGAGESAASRARPLWQGLRGRPELLWLAGIVAIGGVVRFATLGHQSFDSGETITAARVLHSSYGETFTAFASIERSGPLYYTLAWAWAHLFG